MKLGITTIQRGRAAYLLEWIAFHQVVGFERFIIYSHDADSEQEALLGFLSRIDPCISFYRWDYVSGRPQLRAYRHSWELHGKEVDAMAFIDGDEFLYSPEGELRSTVSRLLVPEASALGVYWMIYGSSGHMDEPDGLLIEHFTHHAEPNFSPNRHIKTILRSGENARFVNSHFFVTRKGTLDELGRRIDEPVVTAFAPSHRHLCINHYVTQSWAYYHQVKRQMEQIDLPPEHRHERSEEWFLAHDRNECASGYVQRFVLGTKLRMHELMTQVRRINPEYGAPARSRLHTNQGAAN